MAFARQSHVMLALSEVEESDPLDEKGTGGAAPITNGPQDAASKGKVVMNQVGLLYWQRCAFYGFRSQDRARIWQHLIRQRSSSLQDVSREAMASLLYQKYPFDRQVETIVLDTLARHPHLTIRRAKSHASLTKVIKGTLVFDAELSGVNDLGVIAALLLFPPHLSDYDVICCLRRLLYGRLKLGYLFSGDHWQLGLLFYQFSRLIRKFLPVLADHFQKLKLEPFHYTTAWYTSLCIECVSVPVAMRIWDLFLVEGWSLMHRVILSFLFTHTKKLLGLTSKRGILTYLKKAIAKQRQGQASLPNP